MSGLERRQFNLHVLRSNYRFCNLDFGIADVLNHLNNDACESPVAIAYSQTATKF